MNRHPLTTPTGPDEKPHLVGVMCKCGTVWLTTYTVAMTAEGREHSRTGCPRLPGSPV
jgi:hypothetical protein